MRGKILSVACLLAGSSLAGEMVATVGREAERPVIDGVRDAVYARSMPLGGFSMRRTMQFAWAWTTVRLVHDGRFLYGFAACCQRDAPKLLAAKDDAGNRLDFCFLTEKGFREYSFGPSGRVRLDFAHADDANAWVHAKEPKSALRSAVARGPNDTWCVEFAIPLAELGGTSWRFNVRRIRPGQMESFWQRQEVGDCWHVGADFGTLRLADKPLGDLAFAEFPKFESTGRFAKAVTNDAGRIVYNYVYEYPRPPYVKIAPANLDRGMLALDGGIGFEARLTWLSRHNYPVPGKRDGNAVNVPLKIRFRVPHGISVKGARLVRSQDGFDLFEQTSPCAYNANHYLKSFFTTTLPEGTRGEIAYATHYQDGGEPMRTFRFRVTSVRAATPPKRFSTGFYTLYVSNADAVRNWARIGVNTFAVRGFDESVVQTARMIRELGFTVRRGDYFWPGANPGQSDAFSEFGTLDETARALDIDLQPIRTGRGWQLSPAYRGHALVDACAKESAFLRASGVDWCAFDLEGYVQRFGEKGDFRPETIAAFKRRWTQLHPETTPPEPTTFEREPTQHPEAHRVWVDVKCELWGGFFAEMKRLLAEGAGHPIRFSEWSMNTIEDLERRNHSLRGADFFRNFDYIELDTYAGVDRDLRQLKYKIDAYHREFPDVPLNVMLTPSPHRLGLEGGPAGHYFTTAPPVPDENVCVFKEAMTMGAKGITAFHLNLADVEYFRQFAIGVNLVNKVEDIVMDGTSVGLTSDFPSDAAVTDKFFGKLETWTHQPRVFTRAISLGDRTLISVSEYRELKDITVRVNYAPRTKVRMIDLDTDRVLGTFGPDDKVIPVSLDAACRCRLVLLDPLPR